MNVQDVTTGVLIIGSGGAALRAALAAHDAGADVLIASKGAIGKSGATYFSVAEVGAFNVPDGAIDPTDNPDAFFNDIMNAAQGMADSKLARIVADEAIAAKEYLERLGMQYAKQEDGSYMGYRACFSTKARSHVVKNHFKPIVQTLRDEVAKCGIKTMEGVTITNLVMESGECCGAIGLCGDDLLAIQCASVIVACGGASTLFAHNMYPDDVTGDGYAMARRAGAKIANMEFVQAGIGLAWPAVNLFGNQLWEAIPEITNGKNEPFISTYTDGPYSEKEVIAAKGGHFPFSVRDISRFVEIAIQKEVTFGTPTERGNVYLDFLNVDFDKLFAKENSQLKPMWPLTYQRFKDLGADLYKEKIEISCFAHAINGGILINENGESSLPGVYAAGEVAAGPHGADRLGGNMSVTSQVFGKRAGEAAAARSKKTQVRPISSETIAQEQAYLSSFNGLSQEEADNILTQLKQASDSALLIVRNGPSLEKYLSTLSVLESQLRSSSIVAPIPVVRVFELQNLIDTGRMIAQSALKRTESRGSHYREDFPAINPHLGSMMTI